MKKCKANVHKSLCQEAALKCGTVAQIRTYSRYLFNGGSKSNDFKAFLETFRKRTRSATIAFLSDVLVSTARSIARLMSNSPVSDPPQAQMEYKACIMSWSSPVIIQSLMNDKRFFPNYFGDNGPFSSLYCITRTNPHELLDFQQLYWHVPSGSAQHHCEGIVSH